MLQIIGYYGFTATTAILAVNYFDRFIFGFYFQKDKPSMSQLAVVACLSIASKIEETQVPFLLDLQDNLDECHDLILELICTSCYKFCQSLKRKHQSVPGNPSGVIDTYFSCESSNDSWNSSLGLCQFKHDAWKNLQKGSWNSIISLYEDRILDVEIVGGVSGSVTVTIEEVYLNLSISGFTKKIPKGFELMANLEVLNLHGNMLDGTLDPEFLLLTTATYVDSSGNLLVSSTYQHQKILSGVQNEEGDEEIDLT
ncbi:Cyclin-D3-2 [Capsicum baccatum]|uniref:Cyclin-D3-2 n=1 Tax=Capsicum baccatum TaxID=33114 RepID=A0A2G2VP00_CAPBA|nr:Cyclin-D3-2 [Capsicum baccatum]